MIDNEESVNGRDIEIVRIGKLDQRRVEERGESDDRKTINVMKM